jgi:hypothetical protein
VRDNLSCLYKTRNKIIVLYILIFKFLEGVLGGVEESHKNPQ